MNKNCKLNIVSLHDAKAECSCGWYFVHTGAMTAQEIKNQHREPVERIGGNGEQLGDVVTHTGSGVPLYELLNSTSRQKIISIDEFHQKYIWK